MTAVSAASLDDVTRTLRCAARRGAGLASSANGSPARRRRSSAARSSICGGLMIEERAGQQSRPAGRRCSKISESFGQSVHELLGIARHGRGLDWSRSDEERGAGDDKSKAGKRRKARTASRRKPATATRPSSAEASADEMPEQADGGRRGAGRRMSTRKTAISPKATSRRSRGGRRCQTQRAARPRLQALSPRKFDEIIARRRTLRAGRARPAARLSRQAAPQSFRASSRGSPIGCSAG